MATINLFSNEPAVDTQENTITLLNGTVLKCFPKTIVESQQEDNLKKKAELDCFLQHAFDFYNNVERIFKDSRMFLAPVPVCSSGLAYVGAKGFSNPTLGVYLEWWLYGTSKNTLDEQGNPALTYHIAGSPLSGCNSCACVHPNGAVSRVRHIPFANVWREFININRRYKAAKQMYESYSLQQVWSALQTDESD